MNKRSPFSYVARIERVQKWYGANAGQHVNEMLDEMKDTPRGTLSSLISFMVSTGHLVRHSKGFYTLPEIVANPRSVAYDIKKSKKAPSLFKRVKGVRPEMPQNAPQGTDSNNLLQPVTTNEQIAKSVLSEYKRNQDIMGAVDVLKSYGVKVTLEF